MSTPRLIQQMEFLKEIDQLKNVIRQSLIMDGSREENTAEHSWHFAMAVLILQEYASADIDILKTLKMALIHDLVEVYAGDVFVYDDKARADKSIKEKEAAEKLYKLLPEDLGKELYDLWHEYEDQESSEAQFALAVDRIMPLLCNLETNGHSWRKHGVKKEQVVSKTDAWKDIAPDLHTYIIERLDRASDEGML